jgi:hypothetical protein
MTRLASLAAILALAVAEAATAATTHTIRWSNGQVTRIGALNTTGSPTIARAVRVFGAPARRRLESRLVCVVDWRPLGLRASFVNLGGPTPGRTTCSDAVGKLQTATIRGSSFRTQRGLRVGDSVARLRRLHPGARLRRGSWWLATAPNVLGGEPGERIAIVRANVRSGEVTSFVLWIGAAGE